MKEKGNFLNCGKCNINIEEDLVSHWKVYIGYSVK